MKDYYKTLDVSENASPQVIKSAFRKLAFKYHPDTNPGNEKQAETQFKEINEAFAVLGDEEKRRQYDLARKGQYAGAGYNGFNYSQEDIFNGIFTNQAFYEELNRIFSQAGLRFDRNFYGQNFAKGNTFFRFYTNTGAQSNQYNDINTPRPDNYKPGFLERTLSKIINKITRYMLKKLFGIENKVNLDLQTELEITEEEAFAGGEKQIEYKKGDKKKKLVIKIPSGIKTGTIIRLKGMGLTTKGKAGDLFVNIIIGHQPSLGS